MLNQHLKEFAFDIDAMINLAAVPRDVKIGATLSQGVELFEEYE